MSQILLRVTDLVVRERDDGPLVKIAGRGSDGNRYTKSIKGTYPYFFVPEKAELPEPEEGEIVNVETGYEGYDGVPLQKVTMQNPSDVGEYRENFKIRYEDDVPYDRRVSVDYGLTGYIRVPKRKDSLHISSVETDIEEHEVENIEPRVMIADIEVLPPSNGNFDDFVENADHEVLMISAWDNYSDEYFVVALDKEKKIDPRWVREHLEEHWEGHELEEEYIDAEIRYVSCNSEEALLKAWLDELRTKRPDLISGWNWTGFDHPYLINRMRKFDDVKEHTMADIGYTGGYKERQLVDGLPAFDMMEAYCGKMTLGQWRSEALDYVSQEELEVGKVENISIKKEWQNDRSRLLAYNIIDTQLCVAMDRKHGIHEFFYQLSDLCSIQVYDTYKEMRQVEGFLMSCRGEDEILPTTNSEQFDEATGALVLSPSSGVQEWVSVLDLKSLYPSSIISMNISHETITWDEDRADVICPDMPLNADEVPGDTITANDISWDIEDGLGLDFSSEGILAKYIKGLFQDREDYKDIRDEYKPGEDEWAVWDNKQYAIKVLMNSFFGVSDNKHFRLSRKGLGDAITGVSRYVTWSGVQIAEEMGYDVAYGDTDSIMIELADSDEDVDEDEIIRRGKELEEEINSRMEEVADELGLPDPHPYMDMENLPHGLPDDSNHAWFWEFEKLYRRFIQTGSKKRYAGLIVWKEGQFYEKPKEDITGYESVRASSPEITASAMPDIIRKILKGADWDEVSDYIKERVEGIENGDYPLKKIGEPGVLNKPPEEYPNMPVKRATLYANKHLDANWREGDEPWIVHVEETPAMKEETDVLAVPWNAEELPDGFKLNTEKHIDKHLESPLEPILDEVGWNFDELKRGERSSTALDF